MAGHRAMALLAAATIALVALAGCTGPTEQNEQPPACGEEGVYLYESR